MSTKTKPAESIEIDCELLNNVSYATYYLGLRLFTSFKIFNRGGQNVDSVTVTVAGSTPLILPQDIDIESIPHESSVEVVPERLLNPKYLADLEEPANCDIEVTLKCGRAVICTRNARICALPINCWSGLSGNAEMLAAFVRPKIADCQKILAEAVLQLKRWGYPAEFSGYANSGKTALRSAAAAIFSTVRRLNIRREEGGDMSGITVTRDIAYLTEQKSATPLSLAVFYASCLEAARLNPVILLGKTSVGVGIWLYESCFSTSVQDDMSITEKYLSAGVNNLTVIDVEDLFEHGNASYSTSEAHLLFSLQRGEYEALVDIKRCRVGGIYPLPLKVKTSSGYELLGDRQFAYDQKPDEVIDLSRYERCSAATKDGNWQRRLLDLSLKNNLLNFRYMRDCLHILSADGGAFCKELEKLDKFTLLPNTESLPQLPPFGVERHTAALGELISLEMGSGKIRAVAGREQLAEICSTLVRKARSAEEDAGAKTLYLAVGFLKWTHGDDKDEKYAPLALMPINIRRQKNRTFTLEAGEGWEVNTTLLEFLKQEFGIDIRGVEGKGLSPAEIAAVFRAGTANMKDWTVYGDIYLAQFTFARYAMWADLKENINTYRQNALISSLLSNQNKLTGNKLSAVDEDDSDPAEVLTPLPCDSTQYAAVAESAKGTTFVLHGPPGTGKSQTITNIIANAVDSGKRVLFVAEKQAALKVVQKRLNEIGIGDFCLELYSGKSCNKAEIVQKLENTLSLTDQTDGEKFEEVARKIKNVRAKLHAPLLALHKKRQLGLSVYEGIVYYLQNKSAPELMNIETTFYDGLTRSKLEEYEVMLSTAQAAASECGGVYRSPFAEVRLTSCDKRVKRAVLCAAEAVLAELKHLKNYLGLFLKTFNQKVSRFTFNKLENSIRIAKILTSDSLNVFFECDEGEFYNFYNANLKYDSEVKRWLKNFKVLPDIEKFAPDIERELEIWGDNYRSSRILLQVIKRINRCGGQGAEQGEELEWLKCANEIEKAKRMLFSNTKLAEKFTGFGGISDKKRAEFLAPVYNLHALCAQTFMDYNADALNSVCAAASGGILKPLLQGYISAATAFIDSAKRYMSVIGADKTAFEDKDVFEVYQKKCSALIDNIDMLPAWCEYKATAKKLNESGLTFITDAIERGKISGKQVLSAFRKNVYRNFVQSNISADEQLATFSARVLDESAQTLLQMLEEFTLLTRRKIRADLIYRLPTSDTEGPLALELMAFQRQIKGNMRSVNLRNLFAEIPELLKTVAPCMLMSPITVSQFLPPDPELFDIVIFDEASQIPTCEAVPSLARAKSAVIVGDPKQMPPTTFFTVSSVEEETPEAEDLESVLEDCLALGVPEKHLIWHYRSKHESLIAFSNINYYSSGLCTFPSPDAQVSKVKLRYIGEGVYDRGGAKCNRAEAEALVEEVIFRLKDQSLRQSSIGIVTFSTPQQIFVEKLLNKAIAKHGLEAFAYDKEEPLFVKNLENVQGDERDVILFSVCYGPDANGKISLNFGPLNQVGGWRRLNVAVSRAREEMLIFSSMRYSMIDTSRTTSRGVAGLKAFLEFAEKGRANISVKSDDIIINRQGIGKYIAKELSLYGYDCRCDVGVSNFKIDVAVVDPENRHSFILAVLLDGTQQFSVKDRSVMQVQTLKQNNWHVMRVYSVNFFNNPKREVGRIKKYLDTLLRNRIDRANRGLNSCVDRVSAEQGRIFKKL